MMLNKLHRQKSKIALGSSITTMAVILFSVQGVADKLPSTISNSPKIEPQVVAIVDKAKSQFTLWADYYAGAEQAKGVIVLHDCDNDRHYYRVLAESLAQQGLHTLSIDLRGYGESISPLFSRKIAKEESQGIIQFQNKMALMTSHWQKDLLLAYNLLLEKMDKTQSISIIASGCSSSYAVELAEEVKLGSMVMITPKMSYRDKERYKSLVDIPNYFITSSHHQDSYSLSQELFSWNGDRKTKIQVFKGSFYGHSLIAIQKPLVNNIAVWINNIQ